jgi:uncharacterized protein involved in type VI secretion and phage assembly
MNDERKFIGKYRAIVKDNQDPEKRGRLILEVSDVLGGEERTGWALPSFPYAGDGVGLLLVPPVDSSVWAEFEHGDPDYPIWTGCFFPEEEVPQAPAIPDKKLLKTESGSITIDDTPGSGGITIETTAGMKILITSSGIEINNGQGASIKLSGPKVSINDSALEVI